ncbi:hypothetical protein F2Q68_00017556 [Brassica cretica]|uniref:Uncharacterized protein n=2 Tax=Brassica cretica TaxID=69181 RepID=A0ABQ7EWI4_BRACR|nr:hypothetical protein F2Q68_00017556 [Brassica cretica]KAF3607766.1 hypothetical protein DY000_02050357 [Brassica cretica]
MESQDDSGGRQMNICKDGIWNDFQVPMYDDDEINAVDTSYEVSPSTSKTITLISLEFVKQLKSSIFYSVNDEAFYEWRKNVCKDCETTFQAIGEGDNIGMKCMYVTKLTPLMDVVYVCNILNNFGVYIM